MPLYSFFLIVLNQHGLKKAQTVADDVERAVGMWLRFAKDAGASKKSSDSIAEVDINPDYAIEYLVILLHNPG